MATLDWSQCPAVESIPGKVSAAWVFKDTRMPIATVFQNFGTSTGLSRQSTPPHQAALSRWKFPSSECRLYVQGLQVDVIANGWMVVVGSRR
jgi:hypothetical protein